MKNKVSNSMSQKNDLHFNIITPICKICKNSIDNGKCKKYGERPKEYMYAKQYDCPHRDIDEKNKWYDKVKDKI